MRCHVSQKIRSTAAETLSTLSMTTFFKGPEPFHASRPVPRFGKNPSCGPLKFESPCFPTARTSPARPTSPTTMVSLRMGAVEKTRSDGRKDAQIHRRLEDSYAAGHIHENIVSHKVHAQLFFHNGHKQCHPIRIQPQNGSARGAETGGRCQCLKFHQDGARAFPCLPLQLNRRRFRGVRTEKQPTDWLPGRDRFPSFRIRRSRSWTRIGSSPLEEFERCGCGPPRNKSTVSTICSSRRGPAMAPSLVTWPTRNVGIPVSLGHEHQAHRALPYLADAARCRSDLWTENSLNGVDYQNVRFMALHHCQDRVDVDLRNHQQAG